MRQHLYITSHILRYPFSSTGSKFPSQATCKSGLTEKIGSVLIDGTNKISISIPSKRTNKFSISTGLYVPYALANLQGQCLLENNNVMVHRNFSQATSIPASGRPSSYTFLGAGHVQSMLVIARLPKNKLYLISLFYEQGENSI